MSQLAGAQEGAKDESLLLGSMTLTASGTPLPLSRTGASVSVLSEAEINPIGETALASQLARLPGLSVSRTGGLGSAAALRIRGLGPAYVGVRFDGMDIADPSITQTQLDFAAVTSSNLSRLEVLRGSQSALYGSEAIGGVVDITSYRAREKGVTAKLSLEAGSQNAVNGSASVGAKSDQGELAFSLSRDSTDGFSAYAYGPEDDGFSATTMTLYGAYEFSPDLKLGANAINRDSFAEFDSPTADSDETTDALLRGGRVFLEADLGNTSHELSISRVVIGRDYPLGYVKRYDSDRNQVTWNGSWALDQAWTLNWGFDRTRESFVDDGNSGKAVTNSVYGEALWAVDPTLDLSFALRRDDHDVFGGHSSGRAAAAWRPAQDWVLRAVASTGFRAPSLYEVYSAYGNPSLKPETSRSFELGAEYNFAPQSSVQVTLFNTQIENKIDFGPSYTYEQVSGITRTQGAEIVAKHALSDAWRVYGNYTYTHAYAEDKGVKSPAVRVPRHDIALGIEGELADKLTLRGSLHHVAKFSDNGIYPYPASSMPDFTVVNAGVSYAVTDKAEAWLRVENLLDKDYQTVRNYGQPGREVFVGLSTKF